MFQCYFLLVLFIYFCTDVKDQIHKITYYLLKVDSSCSWSGDVLLSDVHVTTGTIFQSLRPDVNSMSDERSTDLDHRGRSDPLYVPLLDLGSCPIDEAQKDSCWCSLDTAVCRLVRWRCSFAAMPVTPVQSTSEYSPCKVLLRWRETSQSLTAHLQQTVI